MQFLEAFKLFLFSIHVIAFTHSETDHSLLVCLGDPH